LAGRSGCLKSCELNYIVHDIITYSSRLNYAFTEESGDQAEGQEEVEGDEEDDNTASPKTGDDSRLPLYLILILVSVMTITGCGLYRRKKRSEDNQ
jgi:hypothetical protein